MIALTRSASESADTQEITITTFMFSDTKSGIPVSELSTTARTNWSFFTARDKKRLLPHCEQAHTLL